MAESTTEDDSGSGTRCWDGERHRKVELRKVPLGAWLLSRIGLFNFYPSYNYRLYILVLTFCCYAAYHMSRKPFSVVAHVLAPNCSLSPFDGNNSNNTDDYYNFDGHNLTSFDPKKYYDGWPPFNGKRCKTLIGAVDYAWLFTYAVFMIGSGLIADRVSLRYFLTVGMLGSGVFVGLLGVAYYAEIHNIWYFIVVQIFVGIFESTGWPGVVSVMGNWLGISRRGLVMGIWNAHTSVGNILGTAIPAIWAVRGGNWSWAFLVPGFVMIFMAVIIFLFLVVDPSHVGLPPPRHHLKSDTPEPSSSPPPITAPQQHRDSNGFKSDSGALDYETDDSLLLRERSPLIPSLSKSNKKFEEETVLIDSNPPKQYDAATTGHHGDGPTAAYQSDGPDEQRQTESRPMLDSRASKNKAMRIIRGTPLVPHYSKKNAIGLIGALKVPGVIEFSLSLFFAKLVAYTFLFWLPYYITHNKIEGRYLGEQKSNLLATLYDVGGIVGGILTGGLSDLLGARAISCVIMMYLAVPTLFMYRYLGPESLGLTIFLIMMCGLFINGPYALITTAVSSDLGTHKSLKENQRAKATVGAIIDGMGSLGAACGPLITGWVSDDFGWSSVFYVLMFSCFISSLMLSRLLINEVRRFYQKFEDYKKKRGKYNYHSLSGRSSGKF